MTALDSLCVPRSDYEFSGDSRCAFLLTCAYLWWMNAPGSIAVSKIVAVTVSVLVISGIVFSLYAQPRNKRPVSRNCSPGSFADGAHPDCPLPRRSASLTMLPPVEMLIQGLSCNCRANYSRAALLGADAA
jgi:hypothetical protein